MTLPEQLIAFERTVIVEALESCGWNETMTAKYLGIPRRSLQAKRVRLAIKRPHPVRTATSFPRCDINSDP